MAYDDLVLGSAANSKILEVALRNSTTGQLKTGVAFGSTTYSYIREGSDATKASGTCVDATLDAYTDHGWKETGIAGVYQFGVPQAALAAGKNAVTIKLSASGAIDVCKRIVITGADFRLAALPADQRQILGSPLSETSAGYLAAAFKKLFDVATPLLVASAAMRGTDSAALAADWTSERAANLDNLDVAKAILNKVNTTLELDGVVYRFTINALEQAPAGGGGGGSCQWSPTQRDTVLLQVGLIGVSSFEVRSALSPDGKSLEITQGDDYTTATGRQIELTDTGDTWPAFAAATLTLRRGGAVALELTDGTIDQTGLHKVASWDMTSAESLTLTRVSPRAYSYQAVGVMASGDRMTIAVGQVDVLPFVDP